MRLIVRRIALYVITAIVAITINFFLPRLMPTWSTRFCTSPRLLTCTTILEE